MNQRTILLDLRSIEMNQRTNLMNQRTNLLFLCFKKEMSHVPTRNDSCTDNT
jgi:hypothetical protein